MSSHQVTPQSEKKPQPDVVQPTSPEQEFSQANFQTLQRLVGAPDDPMQNRLNRLPASQRRQAILQMQRTQGNAYVQRMMSTHYPVAPTIQRQPASIQRDPASGIAEGTKFSFPEKKWQLDKAIGGLPIQLDSIKLGGEIAVAAKEKNDGDVQAGIAGDSTGHAGFYAEATKEWTKFAEGTSNEIGIESKGEAKVTTNGGEIGLTLIGVKHKHAAIAIKFDLLSYDAKESELAFANLSIPIDIIPVNKKVVTADGTELTLEIKATLTLVFEPDWLTIGKWVAERLAAEALVGLGAAAGILAVSFAVIAPALVQASLGGEVAERVSAAIKYTNQFCGAYQAAMTGGEGDTSTTWGLKGVESAQQVIKQANVPREAMYEVAKKKDLRSEAFGVGWPKIKDSLLADYRDEHWFEWKVYGESGPGYKILNRLLNEPEHLIF